MPDKPTAGKTTKGTARVRPPRHCRKCGREGARSDGCGTSHEPLKKKPDDDDEREIEIDQPAPPPPRTAAIAARNTSIRQNARSTNDADHHPPPPRPAVRVGPDGKLRALDTTTVAIGVKPTCPHGGGSPASCSQCVLGAAKVKTVTLVGGQVIVDGEAQRSTREHELANVGSPKTQQARRRGGLVGGGVLAARARSRDDDHEAA